MKRSKLEFLDGKLKEMRYARDERIRAMESIQANIAKLEECKRAINIEVNNIKGDRELITNYARLLDSVRNITLEERYKLVLLVVLAKRTDMSAELQREIQTEVGRATKVLQEMCMHQFVVGFEGCHGSASENYYDGYSGKRMCVICGLTDSPTNQTGHADKYAVLTDVPNRMFGTHPDFKTSESFTKFEGRHMMTEVPVNFNIWRPLEDLLKIFEDQHIGKVLKKY